MKVALQPAMFNMGESRIFARLVFRMPDEDVVWCVRNGLCPPKGYRPKQLQAWLRGCRDADQSIRAQLPNILRQVGVN